MKEADLFKYLKGKLPDLQLAKDQYSKYDCYSLHHKMDIELKCRRTHYPDLLIERAKYSALMERSMAYATTPVYICSTPEGIWVFRLEDIEMTWFTKSLPKTTDFGQRQWVDKEIAMIDISQGKKI
jgi:hypothetical protein